MVLDAFFSITPDRCVYINTFDLYPHDFSPPPLSLSVPSLPYQPVMSQHGLLTTVAYQLGPHKPVTFALEGAVSMAGQSIRWLRDNLNFFKEA